MKPFNGDDYLVGLAGGLYTSGLTAIGGFWALLNDPTILGPVLVALVMGFSGLVTTLIGIWFKSWLEDRRYGRYGQYGRYGRYGQYGKDSRDSYTNGETEEGLGHD
jgi:hypothetical protein